MKQCFCFWPEYWFKTCGSISGVFNYIKADTVQGSLLQTFGITLIVCNSLEKLGGQSFVLDVKSCENPIFLQLNVVRDDQHGYS